MACELKSGIKFKSNAEYTASGKVIDVYKENTFFCDNKEVNISRVSGGKPCDVGFLLRDIENTVLDFNNATLLKICPHSPKYT